MPGRREPEELARKLRAWLPEGKDLTQVRRTSVGLSNETYFLDGCDLVLRLPPTGPELVPFDLAKQYDVLTELYSRLGAPAVPRPVARCDDPTVLGVPFYVMERAKGEAFESTLPEWFTEMAPFERTRMCEQWITAIGALHGEEPLDCLGPPLSPADEVAEWRAQAAGVGADTLVALFDELGLDNPPTSGRPGVVHGDAKLSNIVWNGSEFVALLDFELAHNGEPLTDVGYLLYHFSDLPIPGFDRPGMFDRAAALDHWRRTTGREIVALPWYEAFGHAKIAAINANGAHLHRKSATLDETVAEHWAMGASIFEDMARRALHA